VKIGTLSKKDQKSHAHTSSNEEYKEEKRASGGRGRVAEKRFIRSAEIEVVCKEKVLSRQKYSDGMKKTYVTTHPVHKTRVLFDRPDEEIKDKTLTCPFCGKKVEYRAYCEFIPRFILNRKKFAIILGISFILVSSPFIGDGLGLLSGVVGSFILILMLVGFLGLFFGLIWFGIDTRKSMSRKEDTYKYRLRIFGSHLNRERKDSWTSKELRKAVRWQK
jgi:hypothetical protein